jgi:hypothetical protein
MSGTSTRSQGYDAGRAHHAVRVLEQAGRSADRCQARCEALDAVTLNHLGVEVADAGCQRSTVRGETIRRSSRRWPRGSSRASADITARSAHDSVGV